MDKRETDGSQESFGGRLRRLRRRAGLSQEELATSAGLSANAVSALERGNRKRPYPHTFRSLADALSLTEDERASLLASVPKREAAAPSAGGRISSPAPPRPATSLLGREAELSRVSGMLARADVRLVTLTGIGGVGKTRLAVEVAREAAGLFSDGAAFVDLVPISGARLFSPTVLRSLGAVETEGQTPIEALTAFLGERELLLVLDNFEHVLDAAPEVATLVESCPNLTALSTSRAPLRVRGENEFPVPPLTLPSSTRSPSEAEVMGSSSGTLFVERVRATSPGFELTRENAEAVAAICWRLAGLPLALELAAAKARFLDPASLLSRLDEALSTAWTRDLPERQLTMKATLDWSYDLLDDEERELFRRLSVFSGTFSLEAVETVAVETVGSEAANVVFRLGALVEQSLVVTAPSGSAYGTRYSMLEPVRQYAREKLEESGEAGGASRRHMEFFLALAERASARIWGPEQSEWFDALDEDNGNLRAAIDRAIESDDAESAGRFSWALWLFWWARGHHREGRRWSEAALGGELSPACRIRTLPVAASMVYIQNDFDAAGGYWREGLRLSQREGDVLGEGYARAGVGLAEMVGGDFEAAAESFTRALPLLEECGDEALYSLVRVWLGTTKLARGDAAGAEREVTAGLVSARDRGNALCTYVALYNLAQLALAREDLELASRTLREGIELSSRNRDRANLAHFLEALSAVASLRKEAERSAILTGAAEGSLREVGAPVYNFYAPDPTLRERAISETRASLGDEAFEDFSERGRNMSFEESVAYALEAEGSSEPPP